MKKLLTLIATMIMCDAHADTPVYWMTPDNNYVPNAITTCTSGGNVIKPTTDPTKDGYRFMGWEVYNGNPGFVTESGGSTSPTSNTNAKNWTYSNSSKGYYVSGEARCSSTVGTSGTASVCPSKSSNPATADTNLNDNTLSTASTDKYCWCKMTGFNGKSIPNLDGVYYNEATSSYPCATNCAHNCAVVIYSSYTSAERRKCYFMVK